MVCFSFFPQSIADSGMVTCVYWEDKSKELGNAKSADKTKAMRWSVDGCSVAFTNENYTVCSCTHLSTFALILQIAEVLLWFFLWLRNSMYATNRLTGVDLTVASSSSLHLTIHSWTGWTACVCVLDSSSSVWPFSPSCSAAGTPRSTTPPGYTSASTWPCLIYCCCGTTDTSTMRYSGEHRIDRIDNLYYVF